ncbi:MAG TPA: signal peptide peptidase SppA [Polyangiales bacterium]|nr:signal peptide peptidase SppA [Polyangiales bacterium]
MTWRFIRLWLACGFLCSLGCADGSKEPKTDELREIYLRSAPPEARGSELFAAPRHVQREVLESLADAVKQPRVKGVFLRVGSLGSAFARSSELRTALLEVRAAKKPLHCYFDATDNSGYGLLAEVCDRISMPPSGMLALTGLRAQSYYLRDLLDRVGITAELLQVGRFKGAADALTRSDMAPELRETLGALLDDLSAELREAVRKGRSLDDAALARAIDEGPHTAASALSHKLVDAVAFDDEARAKAKDAAQAKAVVQVLEKPEEHGLGLGDVLDMLLDGDKSQPRGKRLVVAYVDGTIGDADQEGADGVQSGPFVKYMRKIADDKDVRALLLRIDSPGGSALASDKMWHAVRRVAKRKPVVVSIGDMAASGGYYIACAGSEVFASPSSIVGSIGVVGGKIVGEKLAQDLGVHSASLTRGRNANWLSMTSRFSDSERAALQRALDSTYQTFLSRVRETRKLSDERLNAVAEGRIMSGKRAEAGGLVDKLGGLDAALARARSKAELADDSPIEVWPKERSLFSRLTSAMSETESRAPAPLGEASALVAEALLAKSPLAQLLLRGTAEPLAVLPFSLELQ